MKVLIRGHQYLLEGHEGKVQQTLVFIEKFPTVSGRLKTITDGTTNEEVLKVLIDRLKVLHEKLPSSESWQALKHIQRALVVLESRTALRQAQGVENTMKAHSSIEKPKPPKKKKGKGK